MQLRSARVFSWLWIKDGSASCNIDRDKLSTDCWDNKAIPGPLCAAWIVCKAALGHGLAGAWADSSVTYTPLGCAGVSTVHKSSCQDALCSHASRGGSKESLCHEKWRRKKPHSSHNSSLMTDGGMNIFTCSGYIGPSAALRGPWRAKISECAIARSSANVCVLRFTPRASAKAACIILQTCDSPSANQDWTNSAEGTRGK